MQDSAGSAPDLSQCSSPEIFLFHEVIARVLVAGATRHVVPQYEVEGDAGRRRRIDFAIVTATSKIAIELDGYNYHAEGVVSREKFTDDLHRQNELTLEGWSVLRFSWDAVRLDPETCRATLRRAIIADADLHPVHGVRVPTPHIIQAEALRRLAQARQDRKRSGLVVLPTGLGKTWLAAFDTCRVPGRSIFIVHNNTILRQAMTAFRQVAPDRTVGLFNGVEKTSEADVVFANVASLRNPSHLARFSKRAFAYLVIDEFHHGATEHYQNVIDYFDPEFMLGMTATPERTDRRSILALVGNNLIYEVTAGEAIQRGFLAPFRYHVLRDDVDYTNIKHNGIRYDVRDLNRSLTIFARDAAIIEKYRAMTGEAKAIAFCVSIEHAERAAEHFRAAGIPSEAIHSKLADEELERRVGAFRRNDFKVAFVRDLFNEGVDIPDVRVLLFMRPTESKMIFTQQLGRGLRLFPGKSGVDVLDFIGNYVNAGRVVEYLASVGGGLTVGAGYEKPLFSYDNGCEVHFEQAALDVISVATIDAPDENSLIAEFFQIYGRLMRTPTLNEVQCGGRYAIRHYVARFGTWTRFLERVHHYEPALDLGQLAWPRRFRESKVEDLCAFLDERSDEFRDLLLGVRIGLVEVMADFDALGNRLPRNKGSNQLLGRLVAFASAVSLASVSIEELMFVLDFRSLERATIDAVLAVDEAQARRSESILRNLVDVSDIKEAYIVPRYFAARRGLLDRTVSLVGALLESGANDDDATLALIRVYARAVNSVLVDTLQGVRSLIDTL